MLANITGLVDRLELTQAKAMMPLLEAITNSFDAIEEHKDGFPSHCLSKQRTRIYKVDLIEKVTHI